MRIERNDYERIHGIRIDSETGHYYPSRARMDPPEDALGDVEIWVYDETGTESDGNIVEPHFHVCKDRQEEGSTAFYEIDIEVKIKDIGHLHIWRSASGHTSWRGLNELYHVIKKWQNEKAYDAGITNKEAIRQEWNRNNRSNRVTIDKL